MSIPYRQRIPQIQCLVKHEIIEIIVDQRVSVSIFAYAVLECTDFHLPVFIFRYNLLDTQPSGYPDFFVCCNIAMRLVNKFISRTSRVSNFIQYSTHHIFLIRFSRKQRTNIYIDIRTLRRSHPSPCIYHLAGYQRFIIRTIYTVEISPIVDTAVSRLWQEIMLIIAKAIVFQYFSLLIRYFNAFQIVTVYPFTIIGHVIEPDFFNIISCKIIYCDFLKSRTILLFRKNQFSLTEPNLTQRLGMCMQNTVRRRIKRVIPVRDEFLLRLIILISLCLIINRTINNRIQHPLIRQIITYFHAFFPLRMCTE